MHLNIKSIHFAAYQGRIQPRVDQGPNPTQPIFIFPVVSYIGKILILAQSNLIKSIYIIPPL